MRIYVCEYITGGGFHSEPLPASLLREGTMMVRALLRDLSRLPGVELAASRDPRLAESTLTPEGARIDWSAPKSVDDVWPSWRRCIADADAVWPIAPETDGTLLRFVELALKHRRILLGSAVGAIHIATSKTETARALGRQGIPVVPTHSVRDWIPGAVGGWVVKPDDGAGAEDAWLFRDTTSYRRWMAGTMSSAMHVVQPYVEGQAISLSVLARDGRARVLACNTQDVGVENGRIRYRGGIIGGWEARRPALTPVADAVAKAMPGLWGHVGIDLLDAADGPVVVEVNPRLTTSYVGLADAIGCNPAGLVLDLLHNGADLAPEPESVRPVLIRVDDDLTALHA